jgi:hypothetical protein
LWLTQLSFAPQSLACLSINRDNLFYISYLGLSLAGHFQFLLYRFSPRRAKNDTE